MIAEPALSITGSHPFRRGGVAPRGRITRARVGAAVPLPLQNQHT